MANPVILRTSSSGGLRPASSQAVPSRSPAVPGLLTQLYLACSRCTWHAPHVQRERPTQRGMLTGRRRETYASAAG